MSVGMPRPLSHDRARAVGVERHRHLVGMAGQRLVDGVVDDLVDHVVQAGAVVGVADIHARPLAHGVEALEDLDRFRRRIQRPASLRSCTIPFGAGARQHAV